MGFQDNFDGIIKKILIFGIIIGIICSVIVFVFSDNFN